MTIKRIFLDMDGSLLNSQGRVSDYNAQLIRDSGIPITLVSARAPIEMKEAIDKLGLTGTQIGFNGGLIYKFIDNKISIIEETPLKSISAQKIINHVNQNFPDLSQSYYDKNNWYTYKLDEGIDYETNLTLQPPTIIEKSVYLKPKTPIFKIMLITFDSNEMIKLNQELKSLKIDDITIQQSGNFYLEITHNNAKKSAGIEYILNNEDISYKDTACFGDGHNDLPMFECVGTSIAMGNSSDDIKNKATYITLSNDQDGVGQGIWKYLK